jgi:hypothetical protein
MHKWITFATLQSWQNLLHCCSLFVGFGGFFPLTIIVGVDYGVFEVLSTSGDTHLGGDDFDKVCGFQGSLQL